MRTPAASVDSTVWRRAGTTDGKRLVPEETAVAFSYDGGTYAVMMATPQDLDDFALGFSLTEGIVATPADIRQLDVVEFEAGIELRMWLADPRAAALIERRRHVAGPTGCGLCGIESLEEAVRALPRVDDQTTFTPAQIMQALETLTRARNSIARRAPSMPRPSGGRTPGSLPCARMSAVTMRSTSSPALCRAPRFPCAAAWCFSRAACRWRWCRRPP